MSGEIKFSDNFRDLSHSIGVDSGFQFEFYCQRCNDSWRTPFKPYRSGQASGWIEKGASLFGGLLGNAGTVANGWAKAGWRSAHDESFNESVATAKAHFNRCGKCHDYSCGQCFDSPSGLCFDCAPNVNVAIAAARAQGEVQGASAIANDEGVKRGETRNVQQPLQLVCTQCRAETHGAKFCPECGHHMAQQAQCVACPTMLNPGTKFCTECGERQA